MKNINLKKVHVYLLLATSLFLSFNNCSEVVFEGPAESTSLKNIDVIDYVDNLGTVLDLCGKNDVKSLKQKLNFERTKNTCEWNVNGNLEKRNGYFQARIEQTQKLNLPIGAVICDAQFDIPQQDMFYDDHILITMNDILLASTYNFEGFLEKDGFQYLYDWNNIAGMFWDNSKEVFDENSYCLGKDKFGSECSWPKTETNGEIKLQFPFEVIQSVSAKSLNKPNYEIKVVSIGDNDEFDCEHSAIEFDLDIRYVMKNNL